MSKSKVSTGLSSSESSLLVLKMDTPLLSFHMIICPLCAHVALVSPPFELGPHLNGLILRNYPFKHLISKYGYILKYQGTSTQEFEIGRGDSTIQARV